MRPLTLSMAPQPPLVLTAASAAAARQMCASWRDLFFPSRKHDLCAYVWGDGSLLGTRRGGSNRIETVPRGLWGLAVRRRWADGPTARRFGSFSYSAPLLHRLALLFGAAIMATLG